MVTLLEEVARLRQDAHDFKITSSFPWLENRPLKFQVIANSDVPEVRLHSHPVPIVEDSRIDHLWTGLFWLEDSEWTNPQVDTTTFLFRVCQAHQWTTLQAEQHTHLTASAAAKFQATTAVSMGSPASTQSLRWLLFALFLVSAGFLWLSPKL